MNKASPSVKPISPILGATLHGLNLSANADAELIDFISSAMAKHLVVVIPQQDLSAKSLKQFVSHFGPLFVHHADEGVIHADGLEEVLQMRKDPEDTKLFGDGDWHADVTFRKPEALFSVLHAKIIPPLGGDTAFSSNIASFSALSSGMQEMLRGLNAIHSYNGPGLPEHPTETAVHPVVRAHPETGQESLYINKMFAIRFEGMSEFESRPLIEFLDQHMSKEQFTCRISWQPGQVVIWDNRFTLHYPINDFTGQQRLLLRCTAMLS